jgi:hypothetical protein
MGADLRVDTGANGRPAQDDVESHDDPLHPLAALLRRYVNAYTNCHDFFECRRLMVDDYELQMGEHVLRGRDDVYIPATAKQYRQFPGLTLTVHDAVIGRDRAAMFFSEHGRSNLSGRHAVWGGVSLYRWNGSQLTHCRVEQDYYTRREQSDSSAPNPVPAPAYDPWTVAPQDPNANTERVVAGWLTGGGILDCPIGSLDDEFTGRVCRPLFSSPSVRILDMFTAGERAAFHVVIEGRYAGGLRQLEDARHQPASLYVSGLATQANGIVTVRAITDRLAAQRRLVKKLLP